MTTVLNTSETDWLKGLLGSHVKFNESMSKHTSLRVGGPADVFTLPERPDQLIELVGWLGHKNLPYLVVGGGTNLLVSDKGIRAVVICLSKCLNQITEAGQEKDRVRVNAMAGAALKTLCRFSLNHKYSGMNFALGIPGTIGGAIQMNAGTAHGSIESVLDTLQVLYPDGTTRVLGKHQLNFKYRQLTFGNHGEEKINQPLIILSGSFLLKDLGSAGLKHEATAILRNRKQTQPIGWASAGCFFKNPSPDQSAGWLIDRAGLKGKTKGEAKISEKHANFIVNTGNASAADILWLMDRVREKVFQQFHITLEPEVKIVGD